MKGRLLVSVQRSLMILVATLASQQTVFGHHGEVMQGHPLIQGLSMPLHGLDHMLMAIGVGIIAVQLGGRALWMVPLGFSLVLLTGGLFNLSGVSISLLEPMILASLILAGAQLSLKHGLPTGFVVALFSLLGSVHGAALIQPLLIDNSPAALLLFAGGCVFSALLLLSAGVGIGLLLERRAGARNRFRFAGATLLMSSFLLILAPETNQWLIRIFQ